MRACTNDLYGVGTGGNPGASMYTYAQAETILARLYEADEQTQRNAFRGRLKHLKRVGIPLNMSPGRGKKVLYTREHLFQWALCLEFAEFGIDPTVTSHFIHTMWGHFYLIVTWMLSKPDDGNDIVYTINPVVMSKTWAYRDVAFKFREQFLDFLNYRPGQVSDAAELIGELKNICRRAMLINVSEVLRMIDAESRNLGIEPEIPEIRAKRVGDGIVAVD